MSSYRVSGFNQRGEALVSDEKGTVVAAAILELDAYGEPERGEVFDLSVRITWSRAEVDRERLESLFG